MATIADVYRTLANLPGIDAGRPRYVAREMQQAIPPKLPTGKRGGGKLTPHVSTEEAATLMIAVAYPGAGSDGVEYAERFIEFQHDGKRFGDALVNWLRNNGNGQHVEEMVLIFDDVRPEARLFVTATDDRFQGTLYIYTPEHICAEHWPAVSRAAVISKEAFAVMSKLLRRRPHDWDIPDEYEVMGFQDGEVVIRDEAGKEYISTPQETE